MKTFSMHGWMTAVTLTLALGIGLVGCGSQQDVSLQDETGEQAEAIEAERSNPASPDETAGPMDRMFDEAVTELGLDADGLKMVEAIRAQLRTDTQQARQAGLVLADSIAAQTAKGHIDSNSLEPAQLALSEAMKACVPAMQKAMNELHKLLTPAQRTKLVELLKSHREAAMTRAIAAHTGDVAQEAGPLQMKMHKLATALNLTADQREVLRSAIRQELRGIILSHAPEHGERRAHLEAIGQAFVTDSFDAQTAGVGKYAGSGIQRFGSNAARVLNVALPNLTQEQRDKLAGIIRTKAAARLNRPY